MQKVRLIEVPSEIGAGTRGASLGIAAIRIAALDFMSNFFIRYPAVKVPAENSLLYEKVDTPFARRIKGIYALYERAAAAVKAGLNEQCFPVVLSGDHSIAGATIAGIRMCKPGSRLGVIWFDAHADLHTPLYYAIREYARHAGRQWPARA